MSELARPKDISISFMLDISSKHNLRSRTGQLHSFLISRAYKIKNIGYSLHEQMADRLKGT